MGQDSNRRGIGARALHVLSLHQASVVATIADVIIPGGPDLPSATEANVIGYIDRALEGMDAHLVPIYKKGLGALDKVCKDEFGVASFTDLTPRDRVSLVSRFLGPPSEKLGLPGSADASEKEQLLISLFAIIREHVIEGYLCDPSYGGNMNACVWRAIGFPGAHWGYTADQVTARALDARSLPVKTLDDLAWEVTNMPKPDSSGDR